MVATGQFTPEDAIRHWERPQAIVSGQAIFYGKSLAPKWVTDLERRFATTRHEAPKWPPPDWWLSGMRLVEARARFDKYTSGLTDGEWQAILDRCNEANKASPDADAFWKELDAYEKLARNFGKGLLLANVQKANTDE